MDQQELRQQRQAWDRIAAGYDEFVTPTHAWLADQALSVANLEPGESFLDVACGTGALSLAAARRGADVVGVDVSPRMVERLAARARREGIGPIKALEMDGHDLEFERDSFDVSGSQFGIMLFPDLPRALRELVRVTRGGGRALLIVYGPPQQVEFLQFFVQAMQKVVPDFEGLPSDPPPLPFQVAEPARLRESLTEAGLREVRVDTLTEELAFDSGLHMWRWLMNSNPIPGMLTAGLTEQARSEVIAALDDLLATRANGRGAATLTNPVHIGTGTVP